MSELPSVEALKLVDGILAEMGIDITEGAENPNIAAYTRMLLDIEQGKIDREQEGEA